jgi:hypothetical protein
MNRRMIGIALLALAAGFGACGGKDNSSTTTPKAGSGGHGGAGGSGGPVTCLKETCKAVDGVDAAPCCMDPFAGGCGVMSGAACVKAPTPDARCPVPDGAAMLFTIPGGTPPLLTGCCTADNECGVDSGMGGCMSRTAACQYLPKQYVSMIMPLTCDGETMPIPDNCGSNMTFPGFGGSGAGTAGAGGGN